MKQYQVGIKSGVLPNDIDADSPEQAAWIYVRRSHERFALFDRREKLVVSSLELDMRDGVMTTDIMKVTHSEKLITEYSSEIDRVLSELFNKKIKEAVE